MHYRDMAVAEISKLPGVADLPMKAKLFFSKALVEEDKGNHETAEQYLDKAVAAEIAAPLA